MNEDTRQYQAYLLRLWQESPNMPWRATVQDPHGNGRWQFRDVAELIQFIGQRVDVAVQIEQTSGGNDETKS